MFEEVDEIVLQDPELPFIAGRLAEPVQPNLVRMRELLAASKCNVMLVDGVDQVSAVFLLHQRCSQGVLHSLAFRALLFVHNRQHASAPSFRLNCCGLRSQEQILCFLPAVCVSVLLAALRFHAALHRRIRQCIHK